MSYQAYIDNIKAKTGLSSDDFRRLAQGKNLGRISDAIAWLKADFGLGHGHANTIAHILLKPDARDIPQEDKLAGHFQANKAKWRGPYEAFASQLQEIGPDVELSANSTYVNVKRGAKRLGIIQISSAQRIDVGLKLKGARATGRLEQAGSWNAMVTHRVRIESPEALDREVLGWFAQAYEAAG